MSKVGKCRDCKQEKELVYGLRCYTCMREANNRSKQKMRKKDPERNARHVKKSNDSRIDKISEWNRLHPEVKRNITLRKAYGITLEEYNRMLESQGGGCDICGKKPKPTRDLPVDHCHTTGEVRGILCDSCNMVLGRLGDTLPEVDASVEKIRRYLLKGRNENSRTIQSSSEGLFWEVMV